MIENESLNLIKVSKIV